MKKITISKVANGFKHTCNICGASAIFSRQHDSFWHVCDPDNPPPRSNCFSTCGDHLHTLIKKYTGQSYTAKCGCNDMVRQMNAWGPDGCREPENTKTIVKKMTKEAKNRSWATGLMASVPIASRLGMRAMVLYAIRLAEQETINSKE